MLLDARSRAEAQAQLSAALAHQRQQCLQRGRFRGGQCTGQIRAVDPDPDGADQSGGAAGGPQTGLDQVGGGGLARRSGDPDDRQRLRGPPVHLRGHRAEHAARIGVNQHRHCPGGAEQFGAGGVGQNRDGAPLDRIGGEGRAVRRRARQGGEEVAGPGVLAAQGDAGDGDVAAAFKESEPFAQAALRASINIESLLDRLPAQSGPAVVSLVAVHDGDGTTTLARSLVRAFGDRGRKVCLVALDSTSAETALVTVGTGDSAPSVVATTATLTVGGVRRALDAMRGEGDIVLVDSVAFESSVDAQLTVAAADAALVVVSPLTTTTAALTELTAGIEVLEKPVLGVIINGVTESNTVDGYYL